MMKQNFYFLMILTTILCTISGCQLAATGSSGEGELVGYYITATSISDRADENGKIYAEAAENGKETTYTFPGIDGVPFCNLSAGNGTIASVSSPHDTAVQEKHIIWSLDGKKENVNLEGTIYISTEIGYYTCHKNPMYQDGKGALYLVPAEGPSAQMDREGTVLTITDSATTTETQSGKAFEKVVHVQLHIVAKAPSDHVVWSQMSADNRQLSRVEYSADQVPETLTPDADTDFLIVEAYQQGQLAGRTLYQRADSTISTFQLQPGGWFDALYTGILWK